MRVSKRKRDSCAYDAKDTAPNQRSAGSVIPVVNAVMSHINLSVGNGLGPDELGFEFEERWVVIVSRNPPSRPVIVYLVVIARYSKCSGKMIASDECAR